VPLADTDATEIASAYDYGPGVKATSFSSPKRTHESWRFTPRSPRRVRLSLPGCVASLASALPAPNRSRPMILTRRIRRLPLTFKGNAHSPRGHRRSSISMPLCQPRAFRACTIRKILAAEGIEIASLTASQRNAYAVRHYLAIFSRLYRRSSQRHHQSPANAGTKGTFFYVGRPTQTPMGRAARLHAGTPEAATFPRFCLTRLEAVGHYRPRPPTLRAWTAPLSFV